MKAKQARRLGWQEAVLAVAVGVAIRTGRTGGTEIIQEMAARGHPAPSVAVADPGEQVRVAE